MVSKKEQKQNEALKTILKGGVPEGDLDFYVGELGETSTDHKEREVGEKWEDEDGNRWEQRKGFKIKLPKHELYNMPLFCPECGNIMNKRLDDKMWYKQGKCFDCVVERENEMRANGTYEIYEKKKILSNMESYYRDVKQGVEEFYENINNQKFVNEFGLEKWSELPEEKIEEMRSETEDQIQRLESDIDALKEEIVELEKEVDGEIPEVD